MCTVLYCTVLYCTVLSVCKCVLYCTVLYFTVLYCLCVNVYYTVLYCTVLYCTVLYCTVLYCTILYYTVLYCTLFFQYFVDFKPLLLYYKFYGANKPHFIFLLCLSNECPKYLITLTSLLTNALCICW